MAGPMPLRWVAAAIVAVLAFATPAVSTSDKICPDGTPFSTAILEDSSFIPGVWAQYYPNYDVANAPRSPAFTDIYFGRLENRVNVNLSRETELFNKGNWPNTVNIDYDMGPATYGFDLSNSFFMEFTMRIVPPCTGQYRFRANADGTK